MAKQSKASAVNSLVAIVLSEKTGETHNTPLTTLQRAATLGISDAASVAKADKAVKLATLSTEIQNDNPDYQNAQAVKSYLASKRALHNADRLRSARIASKLADKRETEYQVNAGKAPEAPAPEAPAPAMLATVHAILTALGFTCEAPATLAPEAPEAPAPTVNPANKAS